MKRIAYMVVRNLFRAPFWFYHIWKYSKSDEPTDQEKYDYLRKVVKKVNQTGRVTIAVFGAEHIPQEEGFILFPNHQGLFDMLAIIESCSHPIRVIIKKEASNVILVKQVVGLLKGISIDRQDVRASMQVIKEMSNQVKEGKNFIIFPEGTRSQKGNQVLPFKGGSFKSAMNAGCPIVPVALINSYRPFDISSIKRETVQVHYLPPICQDQYMGLKSTELADLVCKKIQDKINENIL